MSWWPRGQVFVELFDYSDLKHPVFPAFTAFDFLLDCFPKALFVLNTRNRDAWLEERWGTKNGQIKRDLSRGTHTPRGELVAAWKADWDAHHTSVQARFADHDNFLELDMDGPWQEVLFQRLGVTYG